MIDKVLLDSLQTTGIIDGYEYTLRKLIQDNLPTDNVYEKCAYYLLEYEKMSLKDNIRVKNLKDYVKMAETEEEEKKNKELQEVMPNYKVQLKSKIILERDMKTEKNEIKVFETNIDELIKNKIQLSSHKLAMEEMDKRQTNYGSFAAFALNENEKLRNFNFTTAPNFEPFEFVPILEIRKMNEMKNNEYNENNENSIMSNNQSKKNSIKNLSKRSSDKGDDISDSSRQYGSEAGKSTHKQYTNSEKRHMKNESKDFVGDVIKESINTLNENETNEDKNKEDNNTEENNNERNNEENNNERNNNEDNNNFQEYEDNEEEDI